MIFLHIPKTAGTSFGKIIESNYAQSEFYLATAGKVEIRKYIINSLNEFLSLSKEEQDRISIIKGHFPYGLHEKVNWNNYKYISFIRHPIERLFSEYHFIKDNPINPLHKICNQIPFDEYALSDEFHYHNLQIRMLAGDKAMEETDMKVVYEIALQNVRSENFILGITENFDGSLRRIKEQLHWRYAETQSIRYPSRKPKQIDMTIENLKLLEEINIWDIEFYKEISRKYRGLK